MAKKKAEVQVEIEPWERQPGEGARAFEAFVVYRDLGVNRSIRKAAQNLNKAVTTLAEWSTKHEWVKRVSAWDAEQDRIARNEMIAEMSATRKKQRKQAQRMQEKGMELLESISLGDAKLSEIVSLLKAGMEQERIAIGDVGEVIEERSGSEAVSPVQIYIPDNNRGRDKDTFDDLEVE